jgi:hypothetical protein
MGPGDEGYNYELSRLQIQYRVSQESLRLAQASADAQRLLYEQDREERERRHRAEIEALRRQYSSKDRKGKDRES